jgi:xylose isomerase
MIRPWEAAVDSVENAKNRVRVAFEFMEKLGVHFYCFHDRDVAPEGRSLAESNKNLDAVVKVLKEEQERTGINLLWGTANLFGNPRYVHAAPCINGMQPATHVRDPGAEAEVRIRLKIVTELR